MTVDQGHNESVVLAIGLAVVLLGVVIVLWGDKEIPGEEGRFLRFFSWSRGRAHSMKYVVGAALLYAGFATIWSRWHH